MKVKLVFHDWIDPVTGSIYQTQKGIELSMGDFHSGTTFDGEIIVDPFQEEELKRAIKAGNNPVFYLIRGEPNGL